MTNNKPIIKIRGKGGKVELYNDFIRLNKRRESKDIYFKNITSIRVVKPGLFTYGFIYFTILGEPIFPMRNENMLSFNGRDKYNKTVEIKKYIEEKINPENLETKNNIEKKSKNLNSGNSDWSAKKEDPKQREVLLAIMDGKIKIKKGFQKIKYFYFNKINTLPKKIFFWILIIASFIFFFPCYIAITLIYIISKIKIKNIWAKVGLIILILLITIPIQKEWTRNLLGMNSVPELTITIPATETIEVKGINTFEVFGNINPSSSMIKIDGDNVETDKNGNFQKDVSINRGRNEIKIIGKHGSGKKEAILVINRTSTDEEIAEDKRITEERRIKTEEEERLRKEKAEKEAKNISPVSNAPENTQEKIVAVEQLAKDFYSNPESAGKKYGDKTSKFSGEVKTIDHNDEISVLEFENTVIPVLCRFYSSKSRLISFKQGDLIKVYGEVYPKLVLGVLAIENCKIVK